MSSTLNPRARDVPDQLRNGLRYCSVDEDVTGV